MKRDRVVAAGSFALWAGLAAMVAGWSLAAHAAEPPDRRPPENLIARPGFEASAASLAKVWQAHAAGYQVDTSQRHSGNQSIRLEAAGKGPGAVAACELPVARLKTPTTLVISGWGKAKEVSGRPDGNYAIYVDVSFADGTHLYGPNVPFSTGTHDWEYRELRIELPKPVTRVAINLLLRGSHAGVAWFDDLYAGPYREGMPRYEGGPLAYTTPPRVAESKRRAAALESKAARLEALIRSAEARGLDVACPRVSLTVGRLFAEWIPSDTALEIEDYPADMIDYHILGRKEAVARIEGLADFEARETEKILDQALEEVQRLLDGSSRATRVAPLDVGRVGLHGGAFVVGDKPVFLSGILGMPLRSDDPKWMDVAKALGANLLGPVGVSHECSRGWQEFDESYFAKQIYPVYRAAAAKGFWVNPAMWNYRAPGWLAKLAPDIDLEEPHGWFRDCLDLDHPLTERLNRVWFQYAASRMKGLTNNFCYSLMGEEWCDPGFRGKYTSGRYAEWLRQKHGTIQALNRAWRTAYADFTQAAAKESLKTPGGQYDWHAFNEHRLTRFNQSQIDGLRAAEPDGLWTCWPAAGCLVSAPLGGFDPRYGRHREDILRQSSVSGWDGGIFAVEAGASTRRLPESHWAKYSLGWRDEMIYYDFAKSLCPEKPVFDPELHSITSVYHISPLGVPADYLRTSLWMEHLHGLGAHLLWWWGREPDGTPRYGEFLGGLLTQPQLLDAWGRTVLELRRLTQYVVLFPQLERKVRILYSESSAIHDGKGYPLQVRDAYEALYLLDYPVGFVTERMVAEGKLAECALLVVPAAKHVSEGTVAAIREYLQKGKRLAILGRESLACDEYGNPRPPLEWLKADLFLSGSTPEEYRPQLDKMLDAAGVRRPVRAAGKDGKPVWGVELRTAIRQRKRIVYVVNLNKGPAEIVLKAEGDLGRSRDLIAGQPISLAGPFTLEPRKPMLVELPP